MNPHKYCQALKESSIDKTIFGRLSEEEIKISRQVIDIGFDFIGFRLSYNYKDMTPDAVRDVEMLQGFLFAFIEHCFNPSLLKECDV